MGNLVKMKCSTCKTEKVFPIGFGRKDFAEPNPLAIVYCPCCHSFQSMRVGDMCECDETPVIVFNEDIELQEKKYAICPICHNKLTITAEGFWD